jgi:uncharacterized phiE125 gp8 family phage protein
MWCEAFLQRVLEPQTWDLWLDGFYVKRLSSRDYPFSGSWPMWAPSGSGAWGFAECAQFPYGPANAWHTILLPLAPLTSVDFVKYKDTAGVWQTLVADTDYEVDSVSEPARILPAYGLGWPQPRIDINTVQVRFTAGYARVGSPDVSGVPAAIKQAIMLLVGDLYDKRADTHIGAGSPSQLPRGVEALLYPFKQVQFV